MVALTYLSEKKFVPYLIFSRCLHQFLPVFIQRWDNIEKLKNQIQVSPRDRRHRKYWHNSETAANNKISNLFCLSNTPKVLETCNNKSCLQDLILGKRQTCSATRKARGFKFWIECVFVCIGIIKQVLNKFMNNTITWDLNKSRFSSLYT